MAKSVVLDPLQWLYCIVVSLGSFFLHCSKNCYARLNGEEDKFRWGLSQNGVFRVRSMYKAMILKNIWDNMILWKLKLPLKIKIFLWYLNKGVTLFNKIGGGVHYVHYITGKKLSNIYFLIVIMLNSYGEHCRLPSTYSV
jgi:hypothetical protein